MKSLKRINGKQEKLIALLLTERTIEQACSKANVAVTTYWRWMKEQAFLEKYREARRGILENAIAKIQAITFTAIEALERNLSCENPSVEVRSAAIILEQSIKGIEMLDLVNRLEMLESLVKHKETQNEQV
jgi:hypothetical protein